MREGRAVYVCAAILTAGAPCGIAARGVRVGSDLQTRCVFTMTSGHYEACGR